MVFTDKPSATLKATRVGESDMYQMAGVNPVGATPESAATQANKFLAIVGWELVANGKMTLTVTKEAVENG